MVGWSGQVVQPLPASVSSALKQRKPSPSWVGCISVSIRVQHSVRGKHSQSLSRDSGYQLWVHQAGESKITSQSFPWVAWLWGQLRASSRGLASSLKRPEAVVLP